jgi:hypothetical protein
MKESIEKLPEGKVRKLMDYSMAYRLQTHGYCVVFEERFNKNQEVMSMMTDRKELYKAGIMYLAVHKFIPKPSISWIEEIESMREGRDDLKNGTVTKHMDVDWH